MAGNSNNAPGSTHPRTIPHHSNSVVNPVVNPITATYPNEKASDGNGTESKLEKLEDNKASKYARDMPYPKIGLTQAGLLCPILDSFNHNLVASG